MSDNRAHLWRDDSGAAMLEFTAAAFTFFIVLFGVVEFSNVFYQWNAATKAMQFGARLAAVSDPVSDSLKEVSFSGVVDGSTVFPGDPMPSFDCTCGWDEAAASYRCSGSMPTGAEACNDDSFSRTALQTIVYGRGNTDCATPTSLPDVGMCNLFPGLTDKKVEIEYSYTGLGYAGRPGGPVPTVTVRLINMNYDFILIGGFLSTNSIVMPSFATTVTGEDLNGAGSG